MWSAASVLVCVLSVLGRAAKDLPPIELVAIGPAEVSKNAEAFVLGNPGTIYLLTSSRVFRDAAHDAGTRCQATPDVKKLASILVHEEWHVRNGSDERGAYYAQLTTLNSLGAGPNTALYGEVKRSMLAVARARERNEKQPEALVARGPRTWRTGGAP